MSRFGPVDPFFRKMEEEISNERAARFWKAFDEICRAREMRRPLPDPVINHDPGDEDRSER